MLIKNIIFLEDFLVRIISFVEWKLFKENF